MKPLHIFKPGTHQPMTGAALSFSEADLAASARAYDPEIHEAPIVIGHPSHDAPAHGWVAALTNDAAGLRAVTRQVNPAFAEIVRGGAYKKISASFYAPDAPNNPVPGVYYLRHVGFLGAQPPAIKGLETVDLGEAEGGVVCFEEIADQALPADKAALRVNDPVAAPAAKPPQAPADASTQARVTELTQRLTEQEEELKALRAQGAAQLAQQGQAEQAEAAAFAERLIRDGKLLPRHRPAVLAFMEVAAGRGQRDPAGVLMFGEGQDACALLPAFKLFLSGLPQVVNFAESAVKGRVGAPQAAVNPLLADAQRRANARS